MKKAIEFETKSTNQHSNEETTNQQRKLWNQEWPKQCLCPRDCIFATPSRLIIE